MLTIRGNFAALAILFAVIAIAGLGGVFSEALDIGAHFAPFTLVGGLVCMLFCFRSQTGFAASLVAILASAILMQPEIVAVAKSPAVGDLKPTLKILQFNVWGRNNDPKLTAYYIAHSGADVVVLQEARIQAAPVLDDLAKDFPYRVTCADIENLCGVVILSRWPMVPAPRPNADVDPRFPVAWGEVTPPEGAPFEVMGLHYTWPTPDGGQAYQRRGAAQLVQASSERDLIVAGDFNSTPWSNALRRQDKAFGLERRTRALFTWPAGTVSRYRVNIPFPLLPIDHVYAGEGWNLVDVERGPNVGSDHYPLLVSLARKNPNRI